MGATDGLPQFAQSPCVMPLKKVAPVTEPQIKGDKCNQTKNPSPLVCLNTNHNFLEFQELLQQNLQPQASRPASHQRTSAPLRSASSQTEPCPRL